MRETLLESYAYDTLGTGREKAVRNRTWSVAYPSQIQPTRLPIYEWREFRQIPKFLMVVRIIMVVKLSTQHSWISTLQAGKSPDFHWLSGLWWSKYQHRIYRFRCGYDSPLVRAYCFLHIQQISIILLPQLSYYAKRFCSGLTGLTIIETAYNFHYFLKSIRNMESCGDEDKGGEAMLFENSGDYTTFDSVVNPLYQSDNKSYISYVVEGTIGPYNTMRDMAVRISSNYYMIMNLADERVSNWPLMRNPAPTILITIAYVLICRVGSRCLSQDFSGGKFLGMSNSILQLILIAHNTLLIILNAHIMMRLWEPCTRYKIQCQPGMYQKRIESSRNMRKFLADVFF